MSAIDELLAELCPDGVEYAKIRQVFTLYNGMGGVSKKWADEGNCRFIDYKNVYGNVKVDTARTPFATVKSLKQNIVCQGDILCTSASEVPDECALSAVVEDCIAPGVFLDDHLFGLHLKDAWKNRVDTSFVNYYFSSDRHRSNVRKVVRGVTRFYIDNASFSRVEIPVPPIEVQREIVRILDAFTELSDTMTEELDARKAQYAYYRDRLLSRESLEAMDGKPVGMKRLGDVLNYEQPTKYLVSSKDYSDDCATPVLTAGKTFILGYTSETDGIYPASRMSPVIIFDDFTTDFKWVDFPFKAKSSGMKMLTASDENFTAIRYAYYAMQLIPFAPLDHKRHWIREYSKFEIPIPSLATQRKVVDILDRFDALTTSLTDGLPAEIEARKAQYEYYRDRLLDFPRKEAAAS